MTCHAGFLSWFSPGLSGRTRPLLSVLRSEADTSVMLWQPPPLLPSLSHTLTATSSNLCPALPALRSAHLLQEPHPLYPPVFLHHSIIQLYRIPRPHRPQTCQTCRLSSLIVPLMCDAAQEIGSPRSHCPPSGVHARSLHTIKGTWRERLREVPESSVDSGFVCQESKTGVCYPP